MTDARRLLPQRRRSENFDLPFGGLTKGHMITVGYYDDGSIGEIFITGGKSGEQVEAIARDSAIMASFALQHGVELETIAHAITRDSQNQPMSIIGVVVDKVVEMQSHG